MNDYRAYVENDYNSIYHHGIKGQKWGIRRYQNPDGTLTPEGKKHYGALIEKMKSKGMTEKEIQDYISKRNKMIKGALIGTGLAVGLLGAYHLHKNHSGRFLDSKIKAGEHINTLKYNPEEMKKGHFYAAKSKRDINKYIANFGHNKVFNEDFLLVDKYKKSIESKALKDVKIASEQNQFKTFDELMKKNDEFRDGFIKNIKPFRDYDWAMDQKDIKKSNDLIKQLKSASGNYNQLNSKDRKLVSVFFNVNMVDHKNLNKEQKIFFNALSKKGYGGIADLLDQHRGPMQAKTANIIFDRKAFTNVNIKDLNIDDINKAVAEEIAAKNADVKISDILTTMPLIVPSAGFVALKVNDSQVTKEHKKG